VRQRQTGHCKRESERQRHGGPTNRGRAETGGSGKVNGGSRAPLFIFEIFLEVLMLQGDLTKKRQTAQTLN